MEIVNNISTGIVMQGEGEQTDPGEAAKSLEQDNYSKESAKEASSTTCDSLPETIASESPVEHKDQDKDAVRHDIDVTNGKPEDNNPNVEVSTDMRQQHQDDSEGSVAGNDQAPGNDPQIQEITAAGESIGQSDYQQSNTDNIETQSSSVPIEKSDTKSEQCKKQKQSKEDAWSFSDTEETLKAPPSKTVKDSGKKQEETKSEEPINSSGDGAKDNGTTPHSLQDTAINTDKKQAIDNDKASTSQTLVATPSNSNEKPQASEETVKSSESTSDSVKSPFRTELRFRLVKTAALVTTWICIGLFTELTGPTFKDLELRLDLPKNEATEAVSRATSGRSIGFFVGAVIGGFLVDRFKRKGDLFIGLALVCAAGVTTAVPWMSTLWTMWFLMFCQGTFEGIINVAGQEIILLLWGEKSPGPMHLLHFGFGMGSFLNPLIAQPFLGITVQHFANTTMGGNVMSPGHNNTNATIIETIENSRIEYAYLIASIFTAVFSSTFFWYHCRGVPEGGYVEDEVTKDDAPSKKGAKQYLKMIDPATCADGRRMAGLTLFFLLFMYFFQAVGGERIYSKFIRNFALDMKSLQFTSSEATYLNSSFWISFSIGRFLGFIVAIWVPIKILILVECFGALGFGTLLNIFGRNNKLAVWVLTQPMALFLAPLFPSGVAWSDHYLKMSGVGIMILIAGGSLGGVVYIWIIGYIYSNYGPETFLYMVLAYGIAAAAFASLLSFAGYKTGDRFHKEKKDEEMIRDDDKHETITYTNAMKMDTF